MGEVVVSSDVARKLELECAALRSALGDCLGVLDELDKGGFMDSECGARPIMESARAALWEARKPD